MFKLEATINRSLLHGPKLTLLLVRGPADLEVTPALARELKRRQPGRAAQCCLGEGRKGAGREIKRKSVADVSLLCVHLPETGKTEGELNSDRVWGTLQPA